MDEQWSYTTRMGEVAVTTAMDTPITLPWWREQRWQLAVGAGAAALLIAIALALNSPERSLRVELDKLTVSTVSQGEFHDFIPLRARVVPRETIYLDAIEGGRVEAVFVEPGDHVAVGQPLVQLGNTELELNVLDREARLIESLTQLQAYQTQLEQNRLNNEKALALIDYNIVRLQRSVQRRAVLVSNGMESLEMSESIKDELDYMMKLKPLQAQSNAQQNELRIQQAPQIASQLDKLQKDIEITRGKLANLTVRAPVNGRMTAIDLKVGENRNRGERLGEITSEVGYKLTAEVDEYYLGRLRKGQTATADIGEHHWPLVIARVYPQVKNGTFSVDLTFDTPAPQGLLPGQAVLGKFALGTKRSAILLPTAPFLQHTGGDWIFVIDRDGDSAHRRRIKLGRRNIEQVEVESGLQPGERVITSDYAAYERIDRVDLE